jgi:hypothetical protein
VAKKPILRGIKLAVRKYLKLLIAQSREGTVRTAWAAFMVRKQFRISGYAQHSLENALVPLLRDLGGMKTPLKEAESGGQLVFAAKEKANALRKQKGPFAKVHLAIHYWTSRELVESENFRDEIILNRLKASALFLAAADWFMRNDQYRLSGAVYFLYLDHFNACRQRPEQCDPKVNKVWLWVLSESRRVMGSAWGRKRFLDCYRGTLGTKLNELHQVCQLDPPTIS